MGSRICKAIGKSSKCLEPSKNCLSHQKNQIAGESVRGADLAMKQWSSCCDVCVEQSQVCKCSIDQSADQHHENQHGDSSFTHAVINMVGMLIGNRKVELIFNFFFPRLLRTINKYFTTKMRIKFT